jgi:hypothetical protein
MITQATTVYTLQQQLHVTGKQKPIELQTFFLAKTRQELDELLDLFKHGRTDDRIVEQQLPNSTYELGFRVEWVALTDPNGRNLNEAYASYPWHGGSNANPHD